MMQKFFLNKIMGNKLMYASIKLPITIRPEVRFNNYYSMDTLGIYTQLNYSKVPIPHQGFKIHISCTIDNYELIFDKIQSYCKEKNITFKYISNIDVLKYYLSPSIPRESAGKFITVYPISLEDFKIIIEDVCLLLDKEKGCYILSDKRYKDSKCVYYRYGVMYPGNKGQYLFDDDGNKFYDKRTPYYNLPSFIQEPFKENKKASNSYLLGNYKIKKVIQIKNSGGVYMGEDKCGKKVLIKESRLNVSDYLENGAQLSKKNEADILNFLSNNMYTPKLLESFYDWENYYLIEEFIEGETYYVLKNTLYTSLDETNTTEEIKNNYRKINKIFVKTLKAVSNIHQNNVYIGDISDLNILYDGRHNPTFIDLEHGFILKNGLPTFYARTSGYYNNKTNALGYKRQDFQQLGYLFMNMFCKSNLLNALDLSGDLAWHQFSLYCKKNNVPYKYKKLVHMLIYDCEINVKNS